MSEIAGFKVHPAAELFPMMTDAEMSALVNDIRENGQDEPIEIDADGLLIDGRNRAKACEQLGIEPQRRIFHGSDVWQHVISRNLHRRHLTEPQRAMIAARIATRREGRPETSPIGEVSQPPTHREASEALGVGGSSTTRAKNVIANGTESLQGLVDEGKASLSAAERVSSLPKPEQEEIVERVRGGERISDLAPNPGRPTPKPSGNRPPAPPKFGGNRRKHAAQLDALIVQLGGATAAFEDVTELDQSVTTDEAARLASGLEEQMKTLRQIHKLIKERTA